MRKIEAKMIKWIDAKLADNGLAQEAIATKDARTLFVCVMECMVGIREQGGNNRGPLVSLIQDTVGGPDPYAWCMSGIQTAIAYAEHKTGVLSSVFASEHCMTVWAKTPVKMRVKKIPARGAIAIWNYGRTANGHTGCMLEWGHKPNKMRLVECNTESGLRGDGTIERDGGGVYLTERSQKGNAKMRLVGFIKPF